MHEALRSLVVKQSAAVKWAGGATIPTHAPAVPLLQLRTTWSEYRCVLVGTSIAVRESMWIVVWCVDTVAMRTGEMRASEVVISGWMNESKDG